jgi:hypothetical protein
MRTMRAFKCITTTITVHMSFHQENWKKNLSGLASLFWLIFEISPLRNEISLA